MGAAAAAPGERREGGCGRELGGVSEGRRRPGLPQFCVENRCTKSALHSSRRTADPSWGCPCSLLVPDEFTWLLWLSGEDLQRGSAPPPPDSESRRDATSRSPQTSQELTVCPENFSHFGGR